MVSVLPSRIINYKVSATSPTDELFVLGQILAEVGDYAGTILDNEHLSLARKCTSRLEKVVRELVVRKQIESQDELYAILTTTFVYEDLATMTISDLYVEYRRWPLRHQERLSMGQEYLTYYYEGRIVRELLHRKAENICDQMKIDYCIATYHNELDNMSFIFALPVKVDDDKIYPDYTKKYSAEELVSLISRYKYYRDIEEREILIEYVDYALELLKSRNEQQMSELVEEIANLRHGDVIRVPELANVPVA